MHSLARRTLTLCIAALAVLAFPALVLADAMIPIPLPTSEVSLYLAPIVTLLVETPLVSLVLRKDVRTTSRLVLSVVLLNLASWAVFILPVALFTLSDGLGSAAPVLTLAEIAVVIFETVVLWQLLQRRLLKEDAKSVWGTRRTFGLILAANFLSFFVGCWLWIPLLILQRT